MNNWGGHEPGQEDRRHRVLYVLGASLVLAVMGLIAVALTGQPYQ
jgi:hypothetical protein